MKFLLRLTFIISLMCCPLVHVFGQSQQGYVRSIGRPNKPGAGIGGVTLRFTGVPNAVITTADGHFTLKVPDKREGDGIQLVSIRKNGYELKDKGMIGQSFVISDKVPIQIVMVSLQQLNADKQRIEKNAYRVAEKNYKAKKQKLEQEIKQSIITSAQYQQALQQLEDNYGQYISLIGDMADRYARTDYDNLDSLDKEINLCIENGELEKADSLILSVFDPTTVLERNRKAKAEANSRIEIAQKALEKLANDREAIAKDIEGAKRTANLGVTLGDEYMKHGDKVKASGCYRKALQILTAINGGNSEECMQVRDKLNKLETATKR